MRLIGGVLRLDGGGVPERLLRDMAGALTGAAPKTSVRCRRIGPFGQFELDIGASSRSRPEAPAGWLVAADVRLDTPVADEARELVMALDRHGEDFPDRLNGDFAVALWRASRQRLWLGRDFAGVRPLAWTHVPGRYLAFASAPRALHATGLAGATADPEAIALRYVVGYFPEGASGFVDVRHLPPGCCLTVAPGDDGPVLHRAWRPDPGRIGCWAQGPEAAAEELRSRVTRAVRARLPARGGVISQLSGGLDSSAVTVLAARAMRERGAPVLACGQISAGRGARSEVTERDLVRAVLEQESGVEWFDACPREIDERFDPDLPDAAWDDHLSVLQGEARRRDIGDVLTGLGGDQAASYNGTDVYASLFRQGRWIQLRQGLQARARLDGVSIPRATLRLVVRPLLPAGLRATAGRMRGRGRAVNPRLLHLHPDYQAAADAWVAREREIDEPIRLRAFTRGKLADRCLSQSLFGLRDGVRYLHPLLDRQVVDLALALPDHFLIGEGQTRFAFRQAMRGVLPPPVLIWPHKHGARVGDLQTLARRKAAMLNALEAIGAADAVRAVFNVSAIEGVLRSIPDGEGFGPWIAAGPGGASRQSQLRLALRAARLAVHLARLNRLAADTATPGPLGAAAFRSGGGPDHVA